MDQFVVYKDVTDYPNVPYVVRHWHVFPGQPAAGAVLATGHTLDEVRKVIPSWTVRMEPMEGDLPTIVEVWL